jgi:ribosome maturation factor RimP
MKKIILGLSIFISIQALAVTESTRLRGKVVSFDMKTVTIEIAGQTHTFNRGKLGTQFNALKKGEFIEIDADKKTETENK